MVIIGSVLNDKYEILKKIGQGGMSKVYLAMDIRLNKQWAIKEINQEGKDKTLLLQSLLAEVNLLKKLDHPSLPRIVDIINEGETLYVVMDYIEGEPLNKIIREYGPQPQQLVVSWTKQICQVLDYLHSRKPPIIYRDMKPSNIMLRPDGNIKLIDFGIAREYKEDGKEDTESLGTKGYAAPEQFGGNGQSDARTDIYCLGVTIYHLVTGKNPCKEPYEILPIRQVNSSLSKGLEQIITKCTQPNPNDRFQTAMELYYELLIYNRYDDNYMEKQKEILKRFYLLLGAAITCFVLGAMSHLLMFRTENKNYEHVLLQAQTASNNQVAKELYLYAIDLRPHEIDTYLELLQCYKEDASFILEEQEEFLQKLNDNLAGIKKEPEYYKLAFEIGKLYWYYYDYGKYASNDNQITRMKSAIQWFEDVLTYSDSSYENYNMSKVYASIGKFNKDINLTIEEASDKGSYAIYFNNLKQLLDEVEESGEDSEIVKLELYKTILNSIETYARKFKNDDITKVQLIEVYDLLLICINRTEANADKTKKLKEYLLEREAATRDAIDHAFRVEENK